MAYSLNSEVNDIKPEIYIKRKNSNRIKPDSASIFSNVLAYITLGFFSLICLIPFYLMVVGSFSSEISILKEGFKFIPSEWSLDAYHTLFQSSSQIMRAYGITIFLTITGPIIGLFVQSMAGYVLSRPDFKYRNTLAFFFYFTTLFSGGLIPWYILIVQYLNLKNSLLAMLVPPLVGAWNIIMLKNFMKSIPLEICESAKIDGAGEFTIFIKLILPLSKPGLATIGLFMALGYWNDWYLCNLFITSDSKVNLQFLLYRILSSAEFLKSTAYSLVSAPNYQPPSETLKLATACVVTGPIILVYPFVQRFFIRGLTIGSVKG